MKTCGSYSIIGDVNLDGSVTGDGTGATIADDVSAFVAGWGNDNLAGLGDYDSWTKGDLNLDGVTNVEDFVMLRGALNGPVLHMPRCNRCLARYRSLRRGFWRCSRRRLSRHPGRRRRRREQS